MGHLWVSAHRVAPTPTSPQSPEEAEGPWRCPTNPKHTYRRERKEGDGKDGEAGGNGLPHPRLRHLVPVADGGDCDLRAGGQQAAVSPEPQDRRSAQNLRTGGQPRTSGRAISPRTSGRASVQPEAPPPETCCMQTEARERALHRWAGQLRGQSPSPQGLEPKPNATKEASPWRVHGSLASLHHPNPMPRRPTAQDARSPHPRPIFHREPGHRWRTASRCQPGLQMLHAPFFLGEPDEPSCPWRGCCPSRVCAGIAGWGLLSPTPPIPPQARLLLASEAGSQGLGTHPGCACRRQNLGRGLPARFSRSQL